MEVSIIKMGQSPKGINISPDIQGVEFHQGKSFFGDKSLAESKIYTSEVTRLVETPSVVMSVRAPVGDVNLINRPIVIGRGLTAISPIYIMLDYVFYYLSTKKIKLESQATGTTFKAISGGVVRNTLIPIPPYSEQVAITKKIIKIEAIINSIS